MSIKAIFDDQNVPEPFQVPLNKKYETYLLNGELKKWSGKTSEVHSPVYTRNKAGKMEPTLLGSVPVMGEKDALITARDYGLL